MITGKYRARIIAFIMKLWGWKCPLGLYRTETRSQRSCPMLLVGLFDFHRTNQLKVNGEFLNEIDPDQTPMNVNADDILENSARQCSEMSYA